MLFVLLPARKVSSSLTVMVSVQVVLVIVLTVIPELMLLL